MQPNREWTTGQAAWTEFVTRHPELGYRPGKWPFLRISANVTGDFGNVTDLGFGAGLRG